MEVEEVAVSCDKDRCLIAESKQIKLWVRADVVEKIDKSLTADALLRRQTFPF